MPKISELPLADNLKNDDFIPVVQDGKTKKITGNHFVTRDEYENDFFTPELHADNKTMYKFGEDDTADFSGSAQDGVFKSAILMGETLVNLCTKNGSVELQPNVSVGTGVSNLYKKTTYTIFFDCIANGCTSVRVQSYKGEEFVSGGTKDYPLVNGKNKLKYELTLDGVNQLRIRNSMEALNNITVSNIMVVEGDYTNIDVPYFTGMQSSKMPVLRTYGKNLLNLSSKKIGTGTSYSPFSDTYINSLKQNDIITGLTVNGYIVGDKTNDFSFTNDTLLFTSGGAGYGVGVKVSCYSNTNYKVSYTNKGVNLDCGVLFLTNDYKIISYKETGATSFLTPIGCEKLVFVFKGHSGGSFIIENAQIEQGTVATSYEVYKSNTLSTLEPVELRGIGEVRDKLDLTKSEDNLIESVEERILNGSESWTLNRENENYYEYSLKDTTLKTRWYNVMSDTFVGSKNNTMDGEKIYLNGYGKTCAIIINKSRLVNSDVALFKDWLYNNNVKFIKDLDEKVVKTVALDGIPIGYKGGHIVKEVEEGSINYGLSYSVAANRGAQITQNTVGMINNANAITELKIKTATALVIQKYDSILMRGAFALDIECVEEDTALIEAIYDLIDENETNGLLDKVVAFRNCNMISEDSYANIISLLA